ncbi:MAG: hypothetical protein D6691_04295 [Candidatus Hydrogenedentota bacterium]|nr:MAG: hypothetical protein D6691_04295 [Candidatus Hydrogenedentota bacterium]
MSSKLHTLWITCALILLAIAVGGRFARCDSRRSAQPARIATASHEFTSSPVTEERFRESFSPKRNERSPRYPTALATEIERPIAQSDDTVEEQQPTTFPATRVVLRAKVIDRRSGAPVPWVRVAASRWETTHPAYVAYAPASLAAAGAIFASDQQGNLQISNVPAPGMVTLRLAARGYEEAEVGPLYLPESSPLHEAVFLLARHPNIVGRVVYAGSRKPAGGVRVEARGEASVFRTRVITATTAPNGHFELVDVPSGRTHLVFTPPAGAPYLLDVSVSPGEENNLGEIELPAHGARVVGWVVRGTTNQPVTSATVYLHPNPPLEGESRRTETDGQGRFAFFDLSNGPYTIELAQGAGPADSAGQMPSLAPRTQLVRPLMLASGEEREVVLRVGEVTARGRLLRGTTPAAGTLYFSRGAAGLGVTRVAHVGPDGQYELQGLDSGAWLVTLRGNRGEYARESVVIPSVSVWERDFSLPEGRVVGRVLTEDSTPAAGASVECSLVYDHPYQDFMDPHVVRSRTKSDGSFALGPLPPGTYTVRASHPTLGFGNSDLITVPQVGDSAPTEIVLHAARPATLRSVALSFETGQPIREAFLVLYDAAGRLGRTATRNDAGVSTLEGLAPGTYRVHVSASGYSSDEQEIPLREGEIREIVSVLGIRGALRVFAEDTTGRPLPRTRIVVRPVGSAALDTVREGTTDEGGLWITRALIPGTVEVEAFSPDGGSTKLSTTIRPRETTEVTIRPRR